jgi:hypothetical protein
MSDLDDGLQQLFRAHAAREAVHAELFYRVGPQAINAQEDLFRSLGEKRLALRERLQENDAIMAQSLDAPTEAWLQSYERLTRRPDFHVRAKAPEWAEYSRAAQALSLQPVRDLPVELTFIVSPDKKLDVLGARYPDQWTNSSGTAHPSQRSVFADAGLGKFGFSQSAAGNHCESGAALWVQFVPPIAPGFAQVRPFAPYAYQWASMSFKSREDNSGGFGVLVLSWDMSGGDRITEQDYRYFVWNDQLGARYFATSQSPSWEEDQSNNVPEWDYDYAFLYGKEAPYFKTRPNRIYKAAIWCFGACASWGERPGQAIGRIDAQLPLVVIGYQ